MKTPNKHDKAMEEILEMAEQFNTPEFNDIIKDYEPHLTALGAAVGESMLNNDVTTIISVVSMAFVLGWNAKAHEKRMGNMRSAIDDLELF